MDEAQDLVKTILGRLATDVKREFEKRKRSKVDGMRRQPKDRAREQNKSCAKTKADEHEAVVVPATNEKTLKE